MNRNRIMVVLTAALLAFGPFSARADAPPAIQPAKVAPADWPEIREHKDARMKWFREAKFGMFIHWGTYSVPAGTYDGKKVPGIGEWIQNRAKIPVSIYE